MPSIEILNEKHPSYDSVKADDYWALYAGGEAFEKRIEKFWPRNERERPSTYFARKTYAEYRPYIGSVVRHFSDLLFTSKPVAQAFDPKSGEQNPKPGDYWDEFREDCDKSGTDLDAFFKKTIVNAMVYGKAWVSVHQPDDGLGMPISKYDFEKRKLGDCWVRQLENNDVFDWELDGDGNLEWVLTHDLKLGRASISAKRSQVTETWTHYTKDTIDTYQLVYDIKNRPAPNTEVPLVSSVPHTFERCPIVCVELNDNYHVVSVLKSAALSNFRSVSEQNWSLACTCFAQPVAKVADKEEFGEMMLAAGYGIVIGVDEDWSWEAPPSAHFAALEDRIKDTKDEIHRLSFQMALGVENNAAAVGRTAESKSQDAQSTRVALVAYGRAVKAAIEQVYDMISTNRGDDFDWDVTGLDDFAGLDTAGLLTMAIDLTAAGGIPSVTWNSQFKQKLAESMMPDLDESLKADIRAEIDDSVKNAPTQQEQELALFAAQHAIVAGDNPGPGGLVAPQTKQNAVKNRGGTKPFSGPKPTKPKTSGAAGTSSFVKAKKPGGK